MNIKNKNVKFSLKVQCNIITNMYVHQDNIDNTLHIDLN